MISLDRTGIVGNKKLLDTLEMTLSSGRMPHAIALQGDFGLGKKTLASYIAKTLVCSSDGVRPCGKCRSCIQAAASSHPDIRIIEGEKKSGDSEGKAIKVEQLANLVADSVKAPDSADCRVHLILADKPLSEPVQNKLLKVIEEPPPNNYYIITVKSAETLLPTIRSRAVCFSLSAPSPDEAVAYLEKNSRKTHEECAEAAALSGGNIGKALAYLSGGKSGESGRIARDVVALLGKSKTEHEMLKVTFPMINSRDIFTEVCDTLTDIFRDAIVFSSGGKASISIDPEGARGLAERKSRQRLMKLPDICRRYRMMCEGNGNKKLLVTSLCASLRAAVNGEI